MLGLLHCHARKLIFSPVPVALAMAGALVAASPAAAKSAPKHPHASASAAKHARPLISHVNGPVAAHGTPRPMTSAPSIPVGSGPVLNGTFLSFSISDRASLRVNVGSGNALFTTSDIAIPEIGSTLMLGTAYNSLLVGSGAAVGSEGYGWRQRQGVDVELFPASDGSVTYLGEDGTAGKFTPASGGGFTSPGQFHATLTSSPGSGGCSGSAYALLWHQTGVDMCFNSAGLQTKEVDRDGNTTAYSYNSSGQETKITYTPDGASSPVQTVTASYTGAYLTGLSQTGGSLSRSISYNVNSSTGNLSSVTQADGTKLTFGYDSSHDLTSITNGAGNATTLTYDSSHRVTSVTQPTTGSTTATTRLDYCGCSSTLVADPSTDQSEPVSSVPHVSYAIDSSTSLVTSVTDQDGNTRSTTYTPFDDVATFTNGVGGKTTNTYGANSGESLTQTESPTGATESWTYNNSDTGANPTAAFQPSTSTDAQRQTTAYSYDGAGNLAQATDALPATSKVSHNSDGTPKTSTNPMGAVTSYSYNSSRELTKITPPSSGSLQPVTITYDGFGRVATVTDGDGNTVTYAYDLADRVTKAAYTGGSGTVTVTYKYDGAGNLTKQTDPSGTTTWGYDGLNLVTSRTASSGGGTLTYGYDKDGNLTSVTDAGGTTSYQYDDRNLMDQMTDPAGNQWYFTYDADGRRTANYFDANSDQSSWASEEKVSYDQSGRISQIQAYENSSTSNVIFNTSYCYSPYVSGQSCPTNSASTDTSLVQYATNNLAGTVSQYSYDAGNRLTKATNINGTTYKYGYDADGNLTSGAAAGSLSYNTSNQITTSGYRYDGAGNLTSDPDNGTLSYNDAEQLTKASNAAGNGAETFSYADAGQDQVLSDGTSTGITYGLAGQDGQPWVQSYIPALSDSSKTVYVLHDQQGTPLGQVQEGSAEAYITDNLGSVVARVDSSGTTVMTYTYDPYGVTAPTGNRTGFTGGFTDEGDPLGGGVPETEYVHLGQRWYNPQTGAFTGQDPITTLDNPADGNGYAYAADNPANYTDPTGQFSLGGLISAVFGAAALVLGSLASLGVGDVVILGAAALALGEPAAVYSLVCSFTTCQ